MTLVQPPVDRRVLPLTPTTRHGSRSLMTCFFRCGNACDHPEPNRSEQRSHPGRDRQGAAAPGGPQGRRRRLGRPGARRRRRRRTERAGGRRAGALAAAPATAGLASAAFRRSGRTSATRSPWPRASTSSVVIRWGDPVVAGAPRFDPFAPVGGGRAQAVRLQLRLRRRCCPLRGDRALLVVNHEYTDEILMFPADAYTDARDQGDRDGNHGMSVVEVKRGRTPGSWKRVTS